MSLDLTRCDREPIHIPGAIMPFGALLLCEEKTGKIVQASANSAEYLGATPDKLLGQSIEEFLNLDPVTYSLNGLRYYEFEPKPSTNAAQLNRRTRESMEKIHEQTGWQGFLNEGARQIQALTGYDRVMVYRFHEDLHGEVVAEACNPGVESYLGLHYPASDIPAPARKVFLENWVRMIPAVDYAPVPFKPELNPLTNATPDLGRTLLRSVSPIHLEYLRNMKVGASLTLSIVSDGKLWGLIACHHLTPRYADRELRGACEVLARFISGLLRDVARVEEFTEREKLRDIHRRLISRFENGSDLGKVITTETPNLLDLIGSKGAAAALYLEGQWETVGDVPGTEELEKLVDWLANKTSDQPIYATNSLSQEFPQAKAYTEIGSGLLAISIPKSERTCILLFRPEIVRTVTWAGNPSEKVTSADGRLHPRASFGEWTESVRGQSAPWRTWEIDAALELRSAILAHDLKVQFAREQQARVDAEIAKQLREELVAVVSHDLKNPIGSILLQAQAMERGFERTGDERNATAAARIVRIGRSMNNLIDDILHVTKIESGTLEVKKQQEDLLTVLVESKEIFGPLAAEAGLELMVSPSSKSCPARIDRDRILQVLSNLVGNAIKFTPSGGRIELSLETVEADFALICVMDTGPGVAPEHREKIFDRYWQANQAKRLGTGLGLAISKGIVESHGGKIRVRGRDGGGSVFEVRLPR